MLFRESAYAAQRSTFSVSVVLVKWGLWRGVVQQGEAQNNDCLFVVVLLAVIIAPPPLKDASRYASKQVGTHMHTLTYPQECTHTTAGTCAHTYKCRHTHPSFVKISTCASLEICVSNCDMWEKEAKFFLKRSRRKRSYLDFTAMLCENSNMSILICWKLWQHRNNFFFPYNAILYPMTKST